MDTRRYDTRRGTVTMRPETEADEGFLHALFRSHAERPLKAAGLPEAAIAQMTAFQFRSSTATHHAMFPEAAYSIIESDGHPIGRLIEQDEGDNVYFVDFALLPDRQARGLGTAFIEMVADEWALTGRGARVEVRIGNVHSLKLCRNLGFVEAGGASGHINLVRAAPPDLRAASTG